MIRAMSPAGLFMVVLLCMTGVSGDADVVGVPVVTDGDTIRIGDDSLRLHGIDAPEIDQSCIADGQFWPCGSQAAEALREQIADAEVQCAVRDRDRYGRIVGECFLGDINLNAWMVSMGWALAYRRYAKDYIAEESTARKAQRGLWRGPFIAPWDWRRGTRFEEPVEQTEINRDPSCRIKGNISSSGNQIFHMPGGAFYDMTKIDPASGERWFCTEDEAIEAGWRKSGR